MRTSALYSSAMFGLGASLVDPRSLCCSWSAGVKIVREYERGVDPAARPTGRRARSRHRSTSSRSSSRCTRSICGRSRSTCPSQDVITRDNVSVKVSAVLYFRVVDPAARHHRGAELPVRDLAAGADDPAQRVRPGAARRAAGRARPAQRAAAGDHRYQHRAVGHQGDDGRDQAHRSARRRCSARWPRQAEAERVRRAKVISAEGEFQAAARLGEAAQVMEKERDRHPAPACCRRSARSGPRGTTRIIVPLPIDLLQRVCSAARREKA